MVCYPPKYSCLRAAGAALPLAPDRLNQPRRYTSLIDPRGNDPFLQGNRRHGQQAVLAGVAVQLGAERLGLERYGPPVTVAGHTVVGWTDHVATQEHFAVRAFPSGPISRQAQ